MTIMPAMLKKINQEKMN